MDEEKKPSPPETPPLGYWHPGERAPSSVRLAFSFIGGFVASFATVGLLGFTCDFGVFDNGRAQQQKMLGRTVFATWIGCLIASIIWFFIFRKHQRELPLDLRRHPNRYFQLGMLIGLGVAALLEGICFGALGS
jgi:hypothetical protein